MRYSDIRKELQHKERTISDLATYINNRTSQSSPNYSLLLGAGASVTSGISTGADLVEQWRKEVYESFNQSEDYEIDRAKEYFIKHGGAWYNPLNEYSSLFEKKFDLPSQRRRFVEQQVDRKLPSIGYSYLVSLSSHSDRYFDTVFTTNFDDLVNESFYQFSQVRPIVCAHDSSVDSISVTSTRPKIIKLHGDYLFDDIKSTLRETESLELNIKNKLLEFSKEYGLIVIGYSGSDRSIMDVINYMLKSEDYLKNGVYWCLREDDEINPELRKLLWKDRVYFVRIDGFDELMSDIHHSIKGELSLKDNFTDSKKDAIVESFTDDVFGLSRKSDYIKGDIDKLRKHKHEMDVSKLIREISSGGDDSNNVIYEADFKNLLNLDNLIKSENYKAAKEQAEKLISECRDLDLKIRYLKKLISVNVELDLREEAISLSDKLISIDPYDFSNVRTKSSLYNDPTRRCEYLESVSSQFDFSYGFQNYLVRCANVEMKHSKGKPVFSYEQMLSRCDKSLSLYPSLDNPAWLIKLDIIGEIYKEKRDKKSKKEKDDLVVYIKESVEKINKNHIASYRVRLHSSVCMKDYSKTIPVLDDLQTLYEISNRQNKRRIVDVISYVCAELHDYENNDEYKKYLHDFVSSEMIKEVESPHKMASLNMAKAVCHINVEHDLDKLRKDIDALMGSDDSYEYVNFILDTLCYPFDEISVAEDFLKSLYGTLEPRLYYRHYSSLKAFVKDFPAAIDMLDKALSEGLAYDDYLIAYSYTMLLSEKYDNAITFIERNYEHVKSQSNKDIMTINLAFSKKNKGLRYDDVAVRNVISRGLSDELVLCAEAILAKENSTVLKRLIKDKLDKDYLSFFAFKQWPVIPDDLLKPYEKDYHERPLEIVSSGT